LYAKGIRISRLYICTFWGNCPSSKVFYHRTICLDRTRLSSHKHMHINICDSSCLLSSTVASFKTHLRFKMAAVTTITASMRQLTPVTVWHLLQQITSAIPHHYLSSYQHITTASRELVCVCVFQPPDTCHSDSQS